MELLNPFVTDLYYLMIRKLSFDVLLPNSKEIWAQQNRFLLFWLLGTFNNLSIVYDFLFGCYVIEYITCIQPRFSLMFVIFPDTFLSIIVQIAKTSCIWCLLALAHRSLPHSFMYAVVIHNVVISFKIRLIKLRDLNFPLTDNVDLFILIDWAEEVLIVARNQAWDVFLLPDNHHICHLSLKGFHFRKIISILHLNLANLLR